MNELEFIFEETSEEAWLRQWQPGVPVPATQLLMDWEEADEEQLEALLLQMQERDLQPDITQLSVTVASQDSAKRLSMEAQLAKTGLKPESLEPTDPLRVYLEELAALPVCGDLTCMADQLAGGNMTDSAAEELRSRMVELSLSRAVELSAEYTGKGVLLLDLIQEANLGLWSAIEEFSGDGANFEAYRDRKIRFYLDKAVILHAHAGGVGQRLRTAAEDYRSVDERLLGELGRNPSMEEMAEALHMTVEETAAVAKVVENARILNRTFKPETEQLPQEEDQAVEDTAYFQMRQRIAQLLSVLPEEDAKLLTLRYGLEGGIPMSPQQTAAQLGISAEEVVARETAALSALRQQKD